MKKAATVIFAFYFFSLVSNTYASTRVNTSVNARAEGGNSSVDVNVRTNVNSTTTYEVEKNDSSSNTDVYINQSGEGTSSVNINGKEWKLEGPGVIDVNESGEVKGDETEATTSPTFEPDKQEMEDSMQEAEEATQEAQNIIQRIISALEDIFTRIFG